MLQSTEVFFNTIKSHLTTKEMIEFMDNNEETYLITIILDNIDFLGNVTYRDKEAIKKSLKTNEYYEIEKGLYRMILSNSIYIFKKYGEQDKTVLIGVLVEKNDTNRLNLMNKQADFLMSKSASW